MRLTAFEERYLERARAAVARGSLPTAIVPGTAAAEAGVSQGPVLAGWWARPTAPAPLLVLPNPWDDRDGIAEYEQRCWEVVQRCGAILSGRLSELVGAERTVDEWMLIMAPWLVHLVSGLADRRMFCLAARAVAPEIPLSAGITAEPVATMGDALTEQRTAIGHVRLLAHVARAVGLPLATPLGPGGAPSQSPERASIASALSRATAGESARALAQAALSTRLGRRVIIVGQSGLRPVEAVRLFAGAPRARLTRPAVLIASRLQVPAADPDVRARLTLSGACEPEDPLTQLVLRLLPELLPRSLLEGHHDLVAASRKGYGDPCNVVIYAYGVDDVQNEFLARCLAAGRSFTFVQHGGTYLQAKVNAQERLEIRRDSLFVSWGGAGEGIRPMPQARLERIRGRYRGGEAVVLIENVEPPDVYVHRFVSAALGNQSYSSAENLVALVNAAQLPKSAFVLRRYPHSLQSVGTRPRELSSLRQAGIGVDGPTTMVNARAVVVSYPDTPFIEALVIGVPTIGLWDRRLYEVREEIAPLFDALADVGVIHDDPVAAARHLEEIYPDPRCWWDAEATVRRSRRLRGALRGRRQLARGVAAVPSSTRALSTRVGAGGTVQHSAAMPDAATAEQVDAFEWRYVERARTLVGGALAGVAVVSVHRSKLPPGIEGGALSGWWAQPIAGSVVLPNPWNDRSAIALYDRHCWQVSQHVLERLAPALDHAVGESRGREAWELLLGPWLLHVVSALADRRLFCLVAHALVPRAPLLVRPWVLAPATMAEGVELLRTSEGNRGLLGLAGEKLGVPTVHLPQPTAPEPPGPARRTGRRIFDLPPAAAQLALSARLGRSVTLVGQVNLDLAERARLTAHIPGVRRERPPELSARLQPPAQEDATRRQAISAVAEGAAPGLDQLVAGMLPRLMPRTVLEGYDQLVEAGRRRYGDPTHLLVGNYAADELQNEYIARSAAAGKRIAFVQHGGFYFQAPVNAQERLEVRPGHTFLSWGGTGKGVVPLPSPKLERIRNAHAGGDAVVIVEFLEPPDAYLLRFASQPLSDQGYQPALMLAELVEAVSATQRHLVLKRFPSHLDAHRRRPRVLEALPHELAHGGAVDWMRQARVAVIPYPDTPFIEALVLGVPTVGLWDRSQWELREDARAPFDALFEAGVIHEDPPAAAAHLDAIYDDPAAWWEAPATRAAREVFIQRFARPGDWLAAWSAYLRELRS